MLHCDRNRASESGKRRSGDLIGRGVVGQVGLDGEQFVRLALLAGARGQRLQRLTIAIDAGDPDTCCEQGPMQRTVQVYDVVDNGTRTTNRREISTRNRAAPMAPASMSTAICGVGFPAARPRTGWPSSP